MIQARKSDEHLDRDVLLSKVSEYQIFKYFCRNFKEIGVKFCSDLREDKSPTVDISLIGRKLLYKDFGYPDHTFDCFSYVAYKYNTNFYGALIHIDGCFGLGLHTGIRVKGLIPQRLEGRFTVRLKEILNGALTWVWNVCKDIRSYLSVVRQYFSQAPSRISCAWRCLATHPLHYNQKCLCQGKKPSRRRKSVSKK
jgi:hypothetical protein